VDLARLHQQSLRNRTATAPTHPFTMERTPSPAARRLHTPPAPMHGFSDSYEPYSPRRSTRVAAQRDSHLHHASKQISPRARRDVTPTASSKRKTTARISNFTLSPPSSPVSSPQHRSPRSMRRAQPDSESEQQAAPTPARRFPSIMAPVRRTRVARARHVCACQTTIARASRAATPSPR
jgi:hypothetical protein